jgi:hypothetical protein
MKSIEQWRGPRIRTWRERAGLARDYPLTCATAVERAMVEEIAELRAALGGMEPAPPERDPRQIDIFGDPRQTNCVK